MRFVEHDFGLLFAVTKCQITEASLTKSFFVDFISKGHLGCSHYSLEAKALYKLSVLQKLNEIVKLLRNIY